MKVRLAEDAPQSAVLERARYAEAQTELVLPQRQSAQPAQAQQVSWLLVHAEQALLALQLVQAQPVSLARAPHLPRDVRLVDVVRRVHGAPRVLQVSPRALVQRPLERTVGLPLASLVLSTLLRRLPLPPQRHAIGGGPFQPLQQGWSSSESSSRLRQSPAKDQ